MTFPRLSRGLTPRLSCPQGLLYFVEAQVDVIAGAGEHESRPALALGPEKDARHHGDPSIQEALEELLRRALHPREVREDIEASLRWRTAHAGDRVEPCRHPLHVAAAELSRFFQVGLTPSQEIRHGPLADGKRTQGDAFLVDSHLPDDPRMGDRVPEAPSRDGKGF
jgi:hypothetical protein